MSLFNFFQAHFQTHFSEEGKILLACSGGLDSCVLLHLLLKLGKRPAIAHVNYGLRGSASDEDAAFVKELAEQNDLPFHFCKAPTFEKEEGASPQLWARVLRYKFFDHLLAEHGYVAVLTAHHADDAWETFLINAGRGSGINGLKGIPEKEKGRWRPLLPFKKTDLHHYAEQHGLVWREDASNQSNHYLRNYIRNRVTPVLEEKVPALIDQIRFTQTNLQQTARLLNRYREQLWQELCSDVEGGWSLDLEKLKAKGEEEAILYLLLEPYGFNHPHDLSGLFAAQSGRYLESQAYTLTKDRGTLELRIRKLADRESYWISMEHPQIELPVRLQLEIAEEWEKGDPGVLYADKQTLNFPLEVRKWRPGDYFYPFGMSGRKKIAKFFKDEKIARPDKENQWLLCSQGEVVWVIGRRSDRRFAIQETTEEILKITWTREE